jgi:hypothetical protein
LEELMETYKQILENRLDEMEFSAKLQGVDINRPKVDSKEDQKIQDFNERLRARVDQERSKSPQKANTSRKFSDGVGYQVIGG